MDTCKVQNDRMIGVVASFAGVSELAVDIHKHAMLWTGAGLSVSFKAANLTNDASKADQN